MTKKAKGKKQPARLTPRDAKEHRIVLLDGACAKAYTDGVQGDGSRTAAEEAYAQLHAIVRALFPGRQTDRNTAADLDAATRAMARVIRRQAGQ